MKFEFVLDASVAASWFLPDERKHLSNQIFDILPSAQIHVPRIWWYEIHNIFIINERRNRFSKTETQQALQAIQALSIEIDDKSSGASVLALSRAHNLTFYDAAYLELANRKSIPLATFDLALARAAEKQDVALITERFLTPHP